ncbi:hypothetical protein A5819_003101 [Enterococcus sp. 7E2_DIV0204]|uniref:hypothetical protein n=1 Tax=unclassified Enterococcus TaxID=2608891 RepID=UPI000A343258|nr:MULTISPECIES: hypothetical protein [unclassified Enterococcus]OTN83674.1 hypothetical protein A5819_003771 [Enterococcus sp. 7E2_DIV0204]OTN90601.1 hypothetical protein A5819_003101 [Enterococcus sp. 7E2_DIV0204]OTP53057.1 hypothetical protein A5884_002260 [Enterococcus sp. 7D2_DIV0200]
MKKVVYGVLLIAVFGLTACGNDKKETTSSSKVEQLESRVKELESSSSSETKENKQDKEEILSDMTSDTNKKIVGAFLDKNLTLEPQNGTKTYEYIPESYEAENNPTHSISQMGFDTGNLEGVSGIGIETYQSIEDLKNGEKYLQEVSSGPLYMATNDKILSLMYTYQPKDSTGKAKMDEEFAKYKEVFEKIE